MDDSMIVAVYVNVCHATPIRTIVWARVNIHGSIVFDLIYNTVIVDHKRLILYLKKHGFNGTENDDTSVIAATDRQA